MINLTGGGGLEQVVARLRAAGCVFAEDEARLLVSAAASPADLAAMVSRRVEGLPLEQILGWAEFCGIRISIDPGVFVPRRRTGLIVHEAGPLLGPGAVVVDLCCGSGAVGAALLAAEPEIDLYATDVDPAAVACAGRNLGERRVFAGDLYAPLPARLRGRVAVLVANAPYVPTDEISWMPPEAREYEPLVALDGGADGLDVQRRIAVAAGEWLAPGGSLLIETSEAQEPVTVAILTGAGLAARVARDEELDATAVIGVRPA